MQTVVCDSSTLILLSKTENTRLLYEFYDRVVIPPAVWQEVVLEGRERSGAVEIRQAVEEGRIEVVEPENMELIRLLQKELNSGESESIALAFEVKADVICLDESDARHKAEILNLPKTGVIGLLIRAKREGKIESLHYELDRLRNKAGFWISEHLYQRVLQSSGE